MSGPSRWTCPSSRPDTTTLPAPCPVVARPGKSRVRATWRSNRGRFRFDQPRGRLNVLGAAKAKPFKAKPNGWLGIEYGPDPRFSRPGDGLTARSHSVVGPDGPETPDPTKRRRRRRGRFSPPPVQPGPTLTRKVFASPPTRVNRECSTKTRSPQGRAGRGGPYGKPPAWGGGFSDPPREAIHPDLNGARRPPSPVR